MMKFLGNALLALVVLPIAGASLWSYHAGWPDSWHTADWSATGIAPQPAKSKEAIIQVYAARAGRWKGIFAVHTWIAIKQAGGRKFDRYEVVGWGRPVRRNAYPIDGRWYSNAPKVIYEIRGDAAAKLIPKILAVIPKYPNRRHGSYKVWPGPNSNTFVAWVARAVPELKLELPATAIGKDYLGPGWHVGPTASGSGWQVSWSGQIGMAIALREGLEFHILGATLGIDPQDVAIKLPAVGSLKLSDLWTWAWGNQRS